MRTRLIVSMMGILLMLLLACSTKPEATTTACGSKECFITGANSCEDISIDINETFGTVRYATKDCTFTKTLLNTNSTEEFRRLLEGKSLTCRYEQGKFDARWANSIVFGIEYCEGELKDRIVDLMAFL